MHSIEIANNTAGLNHFSYYSVVEPISLSAITNQYNSRPGYLIFRHYAFSRVISYLFTIYFVYRIVRSENVHKHICYCSSQYFFLMFKKYTNDTPQLNQLMNTFCNISKFRVLQKISTVPVAGGEFKKLSISELDPRYRR